MNERVAQITRRVDQIASRPRVVLLEWINPLFCSGHWSPELVRLAGGIEGIGQEGQRSRCISWDDVVNYDPEILVIACCGFDIERTCVDLPTLKQYPSYDQLSCVRNQRVVVTDGNAFFTRPGPRLVDSLEFLAHVIHPEIFPLPGRLKKSVVIGS